MNVAQLLQDHITLEVESLDRIYLNGYVPQLQTPGQLVDFLVRHRQQKVASPALLGQMTQAFVAAMEALIAREKIPVVEFKKGERKDDIARRMRCERPIRDGVVFIGVAQEKASAFKGRKQINGRWVNFEFQRQDVFVKHYYVYLDDADFGPGFIKFCTYAPFPIKVCLNGHEWAKRQMARRGIGYESLDNGFIRCAEPARLQKLCQQLGPEEIERFFRKWMRRLPAPLTRADQQAGYQHQLSVWQLECSLTQVFRRPVQGREFFEEVIRENLDLGRPDRVQLLFDRKIIATTPGTFRTRVITEGVAPSLHVEYKRTLIKQYFKENRALRTETTFNDVTDFGVGKSLRHLPYLCELGQKINRRLLEVQRVSSACILSEPSMQRLIQPTTTEEGPTAPALKMGDPRVMCLWAALCLFLHLPAGFRNGDLRQHVADLMGVPHSEYRPGQMSYDLRRLRLKGIISRTPATNRYFLTPYGLKVSLFMTRLNARIFRPGFAAINNLCDLPHPLQQALNRVDAEIGVLLERGRLLPKAA